MNDMDNLRDEADEAGFAELRRLFRDGANAPDRHERDQVTDKLLAYLGAAGKDELVSMLTVALGELEAAEMLIGAISDHEDCPDSIVEILVDAGHGAR